ncbi:hypothetical protein [Synechococcus sp. Cruz CV-v-12]|uniref:hypothetical protein n=1 Tax=Synechococcus sp. Cruz CV-v-12 TaxID=2823728 RepID=UPI0020CE8C0E|nr:hypothetical protein [Synechococcus sp. Cruz CV-v-12]MCP9874390.1 hypothetical protein [Synechococcus sp. Cruz CV-v-12]
MKAISQFLVHVVDLVEAEGRSLRSVVRGEAERVQATVASMLLGVAMLLISIPFVISGVWLLGAGLMWWLETEVGRPLAAGLTGLAVLSVGGAFIGGFRSLAGRKQP